MQFWSVWDRRSMRRTPGSHCWGPAAHRINQFCTQTEKVVGQAHVQRPTSVWHLHSDLTVKTFCVSIWPLMISKYKMVRFQNISPLFLDLAEFSHPLRYRRELKGRVLNLHKYCHWPSQGAWPPISEVKSNGSWGPLSSIASAWWNHQMGSLDL